MGAPAYGEPKGREAKRYHQEDLGDDAVRFAKWFVKNKFALMESFLGELDRDPWRRDPAKLRARFQEAVDHAQKVLIARVAVTVLLAGSAVTAVSSAVATRLADVPVVADTVVPLLGLLETVVAVAGSLTLVLIVARLALDRYLDLISVTATYTAMQLASAR